MNQETNTPIALEEGDLIEDIDAHIDHAEKFLLVKESRIDGKLELICANNNRWRMPDNACNHGDVTNAYRELRKKVWRINKYWLTAGGTFTNPTIQEKYDNAKIKKSTRNTTNES